MADAFVTLVAIQPSAAVNVSAKGNSVDKVPGINSKLVESGTANMRKSVVKPQTAEDFE